MTLKHRFVILIAGTFFIPFLVSILLYLFLTPESFKEGIREARTLGRMVERIGEYSSLEQLETEIRNLPENVMVVLMDGEGTILAGAEFTDPSWFSSPDFRQITLLTRRFVFNGEREYLLLIGIRHDRTAIPGAPILVTAGLLLFLSVTAVLSVRSINRSIRILEEGTRRIADGDLDSPVIIRGDATFTSLADSFNAMQRKVKEEYDRRNRFFMGVSHDLKTPLSSITGYSDALIDGMARDDESRIRYLGIIRRQSSLLEHRINRLIEYIRLTTWDFQTSLETRPLLPFLTDFAELQREEGAVRNREFQYRFMIPPETVVPFDQELLGRALENLIQNAFHYGDPGKPILFACREEGDEIVVTCANHTAEPMAPETLRLLFEPFYRGDSSRRGEGFGLGLASVKSIVASHGWKIEAFLPEPDILSFAIRIPSDTGVG